MASLIGFAKRIGNTLNNDIVKPFQRDVAQPIQRTVSGPTNYAPQQQAPQQRPQNISQPIQQGRVQQPQLRAAPKQVAPIIPLHVATAAPQQLHIGNTTIAPNPNARTGVQAPQHQLNLTHNPLTDLVGNQVKAVADAPLGQLIQHGPQGFVKSINTVNQSLKPQFTSRGKIKANPTIINAVMGNEGGKAGAVGKDVSNHPIVQAFNKHYTPSTNPTAAEKAAASYIRQNPDKAMADYNAKVTQKFGSHKIAAGDEAKHIIPGFDATKSVDYHEPASALAKVKLDQLLADKSTAHQPVLQMSGGTGSGKTSTLLKAYNPNDFAATIDTNSNVFGSAKNKIDRALQTGRSVDLAHVHRDIVDAFRNGVIPRTAKEGRLITPEDHVNTHVGSNETFKQLQQHYANNPNVTFKAFQNATNQPFKELANIPNIGYNKSEALQQLRKEVNNAHQQGKITISERNAYLAKEQPKPGQGGQNGSVNGPGNEPTVSNQNTPKVTQDNRGNSTVGPVSQRTVPSQLVAKTASSRPKIPADSTQSAQISPKLLKVQQGTKEVQATPLGGTPQTLVNNTTKVTKGLTQSIKNSNEFSPALKAAVTSQKNPSNLAEKALAADQKLGNLKKATSNVLDTLAKPTHQLTDQNAADAIAVMKAHDAKGNTEAAQQIHDLLAAHGETSGQFINSFKLISNRTPEGMLFGARRALKGAGIDITPSMEKSIKGHIDNIKKTATGTPERDQAVHNFIEHVHSFIPSSAGDKVVNFWRAGLLTSPITTGGNIMGNTGEALTRNIWTNPVAAAADKVQSLVTGKRTKTLAGGQAQGAVQGVRDSANYLKTGFDPNNPLSKFEQKSDVNYGNGKVGKAVGGYVNTVYRGLGAQDKPFRQAATNQAAGDLAKADAINLGLKGKARSDYITKARANPDWKPTTFKTTKTAQKAGAYSVFGNETALGHAASALKNPRTYGGHTLPTTIAQFVLPFSQVPASIAVRIMERSNLGTGEIIRQIINVKRGLPYDQRAVSEAIGNGTFGPAVIATGYALGKSGGITGNYPTDPKEQEIWKAQGKQPNAVKVGNRWYSLNYIQPFGALLGIGAQAQKDVKAGKSATDVVSNAAGTAAKSVESQSFLQGINGLLSAVNDPQRGAQKYVDQVAGSIVPNFLKAGAKATDPMQRDTKGIVPSIKGGIPGVRESLPVKQDMFGRNMKRGDNALNTAFNPLRPSKVINDPVVNELARLQNAGQGIIPTQFKSDAFGNKQKAPQLNPDQLRKLQALVGTPTYAAYQKAINDPRYADLSDEQKKSILSKAGANQSDAFKRVFATQNNIPLTKGPSKSTVKTLQGNTPDPFAKATKGAKVDLNSSPDAQYKSFLDSYNKNKGSYNQAQDLKAQAQLKRLAAGQTFDKNVRDLYTSNSSVRQQAISSSKDPNSLVAQLKAYDQALYDAGVNKKLKFANGVATTSGSSSSSGRTRSTGTRARRASTGRAKTAKSTVAKVPKGKLTVTKIPKIKLYKAPHFRISKSGKLKPSKMSAYKPYKVAKVA